MTDVSASCSIFCFISINVCFSACKSSYQNEQQMNQLIVSVVNCCYSVGVIVWLSWLRTGLIAAPGVTDLPTHTIPKTTVFSQSARTSGRFPIPDSTTFQTSRSRTGTTRKNTMCTRRSSVDKSRVDTTPRSVPAHTRFISLSKIIICMLSCIAHLHGMALYSRSLYG